MEHNNIDREITPNFKVDSAKTVSDSTVISNEEAFDETKKTTQISINTECEKSNEYEKGKLDNTVKDKCCSSNKTNTADCFLDKSQRKTFFRAAIAITGILIVYGLTKNNY